MVALSHVRKYVCVCEIRKKFASQRGKTETVSLEFEELHESCYSVLLYVNTYIYRYKCICKCVKHQLKCCTC